MTYKITYDYIPQRVHVGRFTKASTALDCGYVTCKYKEMKWIGESIFSRLTGGFAPHSQKNAEVELKKTIAAGVADLENVPMEGFKLIPSTDYDLHDIYGIQEFRSAYNILIEDPRGFVFAISRRELFNLLEHNGCNIADGVLKGKFCYAFTNYTSRALLISEDDEDYANVKSNSDDIIAQHQNREHVLPSKLVIGKVYRADSNKLPKGLYMYLGKHDVYSPLLHDNAFSMKSYAPYEKLFASRPNDITSKHRSVLYYLGDDKNDFAKASAATYVVKSSVSKMLFESDVEVDLTKMHMPDCPGSDCTYESICNDMKHNAMFNKIDFQHKPALVKMPYELFAAMFDVTKQSKNDLLDDLRFYPFWLHSSACFYTSAGKIAFIAQMPERVTMSYTKRYRVAELQENERKLSSRSSYSSYYRNGCVWVTTLDKDFDSFQEFYDAVQPYMLELKLENGNMIKAEHACFFAKKERTTSSYV